MKNLPIILLVAALAAVSSAQSADITGVITFKGTPPPEKAITPIMDDPNCSPGYTKAPMTQFYVVNPQGDLADVVVYLKGITGKSTGASAPSVLIDQKGCLYTPQIVAIQTGQKLVVRNSDNCVHNVHNKPTVPGNKESNDVQMPGGADLTFTFPEPEMFLKFQCDVHPWMFAWVSIFDSPYYSVTDKDGKFDIKNVPPGKYTLEAVHRKLGTKTQEIEVKDGNVTANFSFEAK